jgi:glycosyltransferase involved in cell wall biosynthesis
MYRKKVPLTSETFIFSQAASLQKYTPLFLTARLLEEIPFEVIQAKKWNLPKLDEFFYLLTRSPHYFSHSAAQRISLIHSHFGTDAAYAMPLAEELKIPFLVSFYGFDTTVSLKTLLRSPLSLQFLLYEEQLKKKGSFFLPCSKSLQENLLNRGYPKEKVVLHYMGTDTQKFSPAKHPKDERYILCVGRHTEKKGIGTLLKAYARISQKHPEVTLIQVGSGSMTQSLKKLTAELNIENKVKFLGSQSYDVVKELYKGAEVFALPSQTAKDGDCEGLPSVILEASSCGVPILSTWHSGIPEVVLDGTTGFLVPEKDDVALADKLDSLLTDQSLAKDMGQQGRDFICKNFDARKQIQKLEAIYDSLL